MNLSNFPPQPEDIGPDTGVEPALAQVTGEDSPVTGTESIGEVGPPEPVLVEPYQFREFSSLSAAELRRLRGRHEEFVRSLAARLSSHLRLDVGLQISKFEIAHFRRFIKDISNPTCLTLLRVEPIQAICLLDIPPRLGLCIVDRELGGSAQSPGDARVLSEIEVRLLSGVVEIITQEWCSYWRDFLDLRCVLLGTESDGAFVQTCPADTNMLVLGMETLIGATVELIHFCIPCAALEPLIHKLNATVKAEPAGAARTTPTLRWNPALDDVNIRVTAELPDLELTAKQLARLKPGDTLLIGPQMAKEVRLCLAKKPKFNASLGTSNQRWAAKIIQVLKA